MKQNIVINKFNQDGFVIIKKVIEKAKIKKILAELPSIEKKASKLKRKYSHKTKGGKTNTLHNINEFIKSGEVIKLLKNKKIINLAKLILKDKPILRNIEFFLKPQKNKMITPFHQDNYFWNVIDANAINIWIACSEASKKNGGICYLNGSQKLGTIKHESSFIKGTSQKIPDDVINKLNFKKKYPDIKMGDIIIHNCEIIHGSKENKSKKDRIGLVFSFKGAKSKYDISKIKKYQNELKQSFKKIY